MEGPTVHLTDDAKTDIDRCKAVQWLRSCQNYDGAFGSIPGAESHAAYTFCAVAALALLGEKADDNDNWRLGHWLAERQIPKHGGFNGRPEKVRPRTMARRMMVGRLLMCATRGGSPRPWRSWASYTG
ncbi:hypothetical protein FOL47_007131 [Perkinsus chesapeaki]|uniref:Geranylgeranyl transferase type II subunit beta n=1 Tax=Perkinsus chesapeaki TaxID=330153 RepID=A0A7J6MW84_PERCH|nr:hypothetical protein FOL47_007131 [Perkinsus chesapeaki]